MQAATLCLLLAIAAAAEDVTSQEEVPAILHSPQGCERSDRTLVITRATVDATEVDESSIKGDKDAATARLKCLNSDYELSSTAPSASCRNGKWTVDKNAKCVWKGYRLWRETDKFIMWAGVAAALMTIGYVIAMVTWYKMAAREDKGKGTRRDLEPRDRHTYQESHFWHNHPHVEGRELYGPGGVASPAYRSPTYVNLVPTSNPYYNFPLPSEDPRVYGLYRKSDVTAHNALYRE